MRIGYVLSALMFVCFPGPLFVVCNTLISITRSFNLAKRRAGNWSLNGFVNRIGAWLSRQ